MKRVVWMVLLIPALAGCLEPTGSQFDGDSVLQITESIVYLEDGSLRPRSPGNPGHTETGDWLVEQLTVAGWTVRRDSFTGPQYDALDKGAVARYSSSPYCKDADRAELAAITFTNLYATLSGTGEGHVVLAAHWDAKEDAHGGDGPVPAANDGAAGVGLLMQLQHHLVESEQSLPFDLTIALFDGEDGFEDCHPLAGSLWAARNSSLGNVSQLILLDMVGDADARFIQDSKSRESDPALVDAIWNVAPDFGLSHQFTSCTGDMLDDHIPFVEEGVSAIDIIDAGHGSSFQCIGFQPYWHTVDDTPDKLSADMLGRMGNLILHVLQDKELQALLQD